MRKIWRYLLVLVVGILLMYPYALVEAKVDFASEESLVLQGTYEDDLMAAGAYVTGDVTVNGDAFVAGSDVKIDGTYNDDLNVAGSQVTVSGVVKDNLRAAGGTVTIDAMVNGNLMVAGGQVTIAKDVVVEGDLLIAGGMVVINGDVKGDVKAAGGNVVLAGNFAGNLVIEAEELDVADSALIEGDLSYTAQEKLTDIGGKIMGEIDFKEWTDQANQGAMAGMGILARIWDFIIGLLMLFVVGTVIVLLTPDSAEKVVTNYAKHLWMSLLYGIIALIVVPILGFLFMITVVGIPLGLILWVLYGVSLYLGVVFAALTIGSLILNRKSIKWTSMLLALALGVLILQIIGIIPWVGGLVYFILMLVGFGSILYSLIHKDKAKPKSPAAPKKPNVKLAKSKK